MQAFKQSPRPSLGAHSTHTPQKRTHQSNFGANGITHHPPQSAPSNGNGSFAHPSHATQRAHSTQSFSTGSSHANANGNTISSIGGSKVVVFDPSSSSSRSDLGTSGFDDDGDDGPTGRPRDVAALLSRSAVLPRTITFKKSESLSVKPTHQPQTQQKQHITARDTNSTPYPNGVAKQKSMPHANGVVKNQKGTPTANGVRSAINQQHAQGQANGQIKKQHQQSHPQQKRALPPPHPQTHSIHNNKLAPPAQTASSSSSASPSLLSSSASPRLAASLAPPLPVVDCRDTNEFRWPKKYLYPTAQVRALLKWKPNQNAKETNETGGKPASIPMMERIGCGLANLGNTCFMNAVLQALAYTPVLANYIKRKEHSKTCRIRAMILKLKNAPPKHHHHQQQPQPWCLFCALEHTINQMHAHKQPYVAPREIASHLRHISRSFRLGRQEDSHEFLRFLLDLLQSNDLRSHGGPKLITDRRIQETTALFGMFGGYFRSQVKCLACQYKSNTYDAFWDLSLEVSAPEVTSLNRALQSFTRPEKLDADNLYRCSRCERKVRASKQLTIFKPPTVLCVHLKRFQFGGMGMGGFGGFGGMFGGFGGGKINRPIEYTERLSLGAAMSDRASDPHYRLYAVLVHSGHSAQSGHYYSYVKSASSGGWYLMDDSSVRQVRLHEVLQQRAYILFYVRDDIETLPIAAPSPAATPTLAAAAAAATVHATKTVEHLNLGQSAADALAAKKNAAIHAAPKPIPTTSTTDEDESEEDEEDEGDEDENDDDDSSYSEGDSDEGESDEESEPDVAEEEDEDEEEEAMQLSADDGLSDDDVSVDDDDDDADSDIIDDASVEVMHRAQRRLSAVARRLHGEGLKLRPGSCGGLPRFVMPSHIVRAISNPLALINNWSKRKRKRMHQRSSRVTMEDEELDDESMNSAEEEEDEVDSDASDSSSEASNKRPRIEASSSTSPASSGRPSLSLSSATHAAAPSSSGLQFAAAAEAASSPPAPVEPLPSSSPSPSPSPSPSASPSKAPIIVSRESFDPRSWMRSLGHSGSGSQFGVGPGVTAIGDWETNTQADTSAKYAMKRKQDVATEKLIRQEKEKDEWDAELDRGHVRKVKGLRVLTGAAVGGASNIFQSAQDSRNAARQAARTGQPVPEDQQTGGGSEKKKRGAHRAFNSKGYKTHHERNQERRSNKGKRRGPRDFTA